MNKNEFINALNYEDRALSSKLYDKLAVTLKSGKSVSTNEFYSPLIWNRVIGLSDKIGIRIASNGIFEEAERRVLCFYNDNQPNFSVKLAVLQNESKFSNLEHKDYLGAMMSLGFKREKLGDLIVQDRRCYCAVCEEIFEYIRDNLTSIGRCPCSVEEVTDSADIPRMAFETKVIVSTSMRLDCIVGAIAAQSRSKAVDMINSGKVLLDYLEVCEKDRNVDEGSIVTIRGYGKFKISETIGNSGSGRLKLSIKKFI